MYRRMLIVVFVVAAGLGRGAAQQITPLTHDRRTPVVEVFQRAKGAVVNISTTRVVEIGPRIFGFGDDSFDDIFRSPLFSRKVAVRSLGSGFLIHPAGYIVTNEHVVRRATRITVSLADESTHEARVITADPVHDLAVLKMTPPAGKRLPALPLGRSDDLMIGESVIAIGNPKGYEHSVTAGVISALNRELAFRGGGVTYSGLIQTDASINPGNSGGPLLNINAQVIGINTAIRSDAQGIGFAIAIDDLTEDLPKLLDFRRINRVIVGMEVEQKRLGGRAALIVSKVTPGTPAAKAGLTAGLIITHVDNLPAGTLANYYVHMLGKKAGDALALRCSSKDGNTFVFTLGLLSRPKPDGRKLALRHFGLGLQPVTRELAIRLRLPIARGMLITSVDASGPAARVGLHVRDVVFQLGRSYVAGLDDVGRVLEDTAAGEVMRIGIVRGNVRAWTQIRATPRPTTRGGAARDGPASRAAPGGAP